VLLTEFVTELEGATESLGSASEILLGESTFQKPLVACGVFEDGGGANVVFDVRVTLTRSGWRPSSSNGIGRDRYRQPFG